MICSRCGRHRRRAGQRWCRSCHAAWMRANRKPHRELSKEQKQRANCRAKTRIYVNRGVLVQKGKCERCRSTKKLERHHPDYNDFRRFTVLCRKCHQAHHSKLPLVAFATNG